MVNQMTGHIELSGQNGHHQLDALSQLTELNQLNKDITTDHEQVIIILSFGTDAKDRTRMLLIEAESHRISWVDCRCCHGDHHPVFGTDLKDRINTLLIEAESHNISWVDYMTCPETFCGFQSIPRHHACDSGLPVSHLRGRVTLDRALAC